MIRFQVLIIYVSHAAAASCLPSFFWKQRKVHGSVSRVHRHLGQQMSDRSVSKISTVQKVQSLLRPHHSAKLQRASTVIKRYNKCTIIRR